MRRFALVLVTGLCLVSFSVPANAKDAKTLFLEGKKLFENEQFTKAAVKFREAYEIKPTWKLLYNIGHCEAAAKRYGQALEAFEEYLASGGDEIPLERQEEVAAESIRLRNMVGTLLVKTVNGAHIFVDNVPRGVAPIIGGFLVSAGKNLKVSAVLDGNIIQTVTVKVRVAAIVSLDLMPSKADGPAGPARTVTAVPDYQHDETATSATQNDAASEDSAGVEDQSESEGTSGESPETETMDSGKKLRTFGWIASGVGAAILIGGGVTGGLAIGKEKDLKDACIDKDCDDSLQSTVDARNALGNTSTILFAVGGALATAGIVTLILGSRKKEEPVAFQPVIGPGLAGTNLTLRF